MSIDARFPIHRGDFSLHFEQRIAATGITALFGPSGCGKTTLLRAIAGLDRYPGARLKVGGMTWQDDKTFLPPHQRPLGYVFQENRLFDHLDVRRNIEYGLRRVPAGQRHISLDEVIQLMNLAPLLHRRPASLSGGEKQRVAISRALAVSPRLLLMDEPLAALDHAHKQDILPYIESLARKLNIPVMYVSHSTHEVARLADHLILMDRQGISASGAITDLLTRLDLPLAQVEEAESLVHATVAGHDAQYHLTHVDFSGGRFTVSSQVLPSGEPVRLRILARDVSLTLERQTNTSILNIFPAIVDAIQQKSEAQVTVRLLLGDSPILARITRKSAALLDIQVGRRVYAQVKSVALLP